MMKILAIEKEFVSKLAVPVHLGVKDIDHQIDLPPKVRILCS